MKKSFRAPLPCQSDYEGVSITEIAISLLDLNQDSEWLPVEIRNSERVILLLLDGLGWNQFKQRTSIAPNMANLETIRARTVVPTTTSTALTSLTTGVFPSQHGIVGYRVALADGVLNTLRWSVGGSRIQQWVEPQEFQSYDAFRGLTPPVITRVEHIGSGFSKAHLGDSHIIGYENRFGLLEEALEAIRGKEKFVYAYWDGIDRTAHEFGLQERYEEELQACDFLVGELLNYSPPKTAVVVTADHGQVHVGKEMISLPDSVSELVERQSGEARFRWLHASKGNSRSLLEAASDSFSELAWVAGVDEIVESGWLGPGLSPEIRKRLGDVALLAREPVGFYDPSERFPIEMISRHGSITDDEIYVPIFWAVT